MFFYSVLLAYCSGSFIIHSTVGLINGFDTPINNYPWMISIRNGTGHHICGGSLIQAGPNLTRTDVGLSAAHCFRGHLMFGRALTSYILAGTSDNSFEFTSGAKKKVVAVQNFGFFPTDDALVLKFDSPIEFTDRLQPVDLAPQSRNVPRDATCIVTGWGLYQHHALQDLRVSLQACNEKKFEYGNNFCAGSPTGSICSGDSGGPLVCRNAEGRQVQEGIVSYSDPSCGDEPATYARVSFYSDWIVATAKKMTSLVSPSNR